MLAGPASAELGNALDQFNHRFIRECGFAFRAHNSFLTPFIDDEHDGLLGAGHNLLILGVRRMCKGNDE